MKRYAPATERNREPIAAVLTRVLPPTGLVLEIASGSGEHAMFFAKRFPALTWQPTDVSPEAIASIRAWREEAGPPNLREPLLLDATTGSWPVPAADVVFCCNMIHIAPWSAAQGLIGGAARVLGKGGLLILYGPFFIDGQFTAPSNIAFDESLRYRDPSWGVRPLADVEALAKGSGFGMREVVAMPANNRCVLFVKD